MYRAKVDSVSGTKVLAGGKWLTCIGNKNVKAGDFIWTDGRCVYGNFQEAQSPIVITTNEERIIPVVTYSQKYHIPEGYYNVSFNIFYCSSSVDFKKYVTIRGRLITGSFKYGYLFSNNSNGDFAISLFDIGVSKYVMALNIDDQGNIYQLIVSYSRNLDTPNVTIDIKKNNDIVDTQIWRPLCSHVIGYGVIRRAFIKDEKNWYCIGQDLDYLYGYSAVGSSEDHVKFSYHLITHKKINTIITAVLEGYDGHYTYDVSYSNEKFQIHDELYFKISDFNFTEGYQGRFDTKYEIFSESEDKIVSISEDRGSMDQFFSAVKLNESQYLFIINPNASNFSYGSLYFSTIKKQKYQDLEQIQTPDNFNACINQCLRPMKKNNLRFDNIKFLNMELQDMEIK